MSGEGWASPADLKGHEYSYNPLERRALSLEEQIPLPLCSTASGAQLASPDFPKAWLCCFPSRTHAPIL